MNGKTDGWNPISLSPVISPMVGMTKAGVCVAIVTTMQVLIANVLKKNPILRPHKKWLELVTSTINILTQHTNAYTHKFRQQSETWPSDQNLAPFPWRFLPMHMHIQPNVTHTNINTSFQNLGNWDLENNYKNIASWNVDCPKAATDWICRSTGNRRHGR